MSRTNSHGDLQRPNEYTSMLCIFTPCGIQCNYVQQPFSDLINTSIYLYLHTNLSVSILKDRPESILTILTMLLSLRIIL
jgi:hypothetical protein